MWSAVTVELLETRIHGSAGMFRVSYLFVLMISSNIRIVTHTISYIHDLCPVRLVLCISSVKALARAYYLLYNFLELATVRLGWCNSFPTRCSFIISLPL